MAKVPSCSVAETTLERSDDTPKGGFFIERNTKPELCINSIYVFKQQKRNIIQKVGGCHLIDNYCLKFSIVIQRSNAFD